MAERVARVKVQATADLKGFDEASKALRDLQRAVGPADAEIAKVRQEILNFAEANKRSEAVINAQINALKQLRQQATLGGDVYKNLGTDVERLKRSLGDTGTAFQATARSIGDIGKATQATQTYINNQAKSFEAMRKQASDTITTLQNLGRQADQLKSKGGQVNFFSSGGRAAGGVFEIGRKGLADVQAYAALVKRLQEQSQTAVGKVARLSEGMFALGTSGVALKGVVDAMGGVSGALQNVTNFTAKASGAFAQLGAGTPQWAGLIKNGLNEISLLLNQPANGLAGWSSAITSVQGKLAALSAPLEAFNTALAAIGPEGAAAAGVVAVAFAGMQDAIGRAFKEGEKDASTALQGITDETQQLLRKLAELSQAFRGAASMNELRALQAGAQGRFNDTPAGTDASRRAANTIANAEARIRAESMAQADVLEAARQKYRGSAQDITSLNERLAYLNQAMKLVDSTTTEGSAEYARFASEAAALKTRIDQLANSYRTVAQAAKEAGQSQGIYANQSTVSNYFNRAAVRQQEQMAAAASARFGQQGPALLPAAGQTSFSGTFNEALGIGGGARLGTGRGEIPGQLGADYPGKARFMNSRSEAEANAALGYLEREAKATREVGAAAAGAETELMRLYRAMQSFAQSQIDKKTQQTAFSYRDLASEIERTGRASDGSLNSLRQQRQLWDQLYNSVEKTDPAFRQAAENLRRIDKEIETRQTGGLRGKIGYIGQGIGAAASAGIFGGPLGAIGGLAGGAIGAAMGGPAGFAAGSFIGSSAGAYAGMFNQAIVGSSDYASEIARLQIALKGVSTDQDEFNKSLSFVQQTAPQFLMSLGDATKNYTRLQASVRGAGMGVDDTQKVFKGLSAAIVATGGGTEQLNGAMLAAAQVFSKGKVSAEELRGQIGERLPGAFTIFAQAVNMTPQQLDKALQEGKVSTEDFVKFSEELFKRYGSAAKSIGDSPFAASIRFQLAMDNFRLAAGQALLPIVTSFQNFGTEVLNSLTRVAEGTTGWQKALGNTFDNVSKLIGGVQGLKNILSGLTKTLIVLGTTMAGVFAVQNIGTFVSVLKVGASTLQGFVKITRELLTLEKAITALKAIQAGLQAFISGAGTSIKKNAKGIAGGALALGGGALAAYAMRDQIDSAISGVVDGLGKQFENIFKMPELGGGFGGAAQPVPQAQGEEENGKAKREAEQRAAEQQRLDEQVARARVALDDATHRTAMDLIRKRYEFELELINKQRDNWVKSLTGAARSAAGLITSFYGQLDDLTGRDRQAQMNVANAQQSLKSAQALQSVTGQGVATGGIIARTGSTGQSTGPHLDARWADGRRITAADVDRYLMVNGRAPSSYGVTSNYGPRSLFGRNFHRGIDLGTPSGSGVSLRNGATLLRDLGFTGAGGYAVEIMTAEGPMRLLHLQGGAVKTAGGKTGVAAQQRRAVAAGGKASVEGVELAAANSELKLTTDQTGKLRDQLRTGFVLDFTEQLREQNAELKNSAQITALRNRLQLEGARPELIDAEVKKAEATQRTAQANAVAQTALADLTAKGKENTVEAQAQREAIAANNWELSEFKRLTDEATAAQIAFADAMRFRQDMNIGEGFKNGVQQYVDGIGTMKDAMSQLTVTGIKGVEDALVSLVTTGSANFREFAASILKDTARMIIQQMVLRTIMTAIGAIGGGGGLAAAFSFGGKSGGFLGGFEMPSFMKNANGNAFGPKGVIPFAMGGIVNKPTLFKFANGGAGQLGLMGEAGPEAIMPLRRGRDGKLGVAAAGDGGGVTVNVQVDATGSNVQGDSGRSQELGRAVAQAVQQELIKQKRPGGLLAA